MGDFPAEAATYLFTLILFSFVTVASALIRSEMLILACIPPVFVALIVGFIMAIYAGGTFGLVPTLVSLIAAIPGAWWAARRYSSRDLLILIYLAWAAGMVLALIAFGFPDRG